MAYSRLRVNEDANLRKHLRKIGYSAEQVDFLSKSKSYITVNSSNPQDYKKYNKVSLRTEAQAMTGGRAFKWSTGAGKYKNKFDTLAKYSVSDWGLDDPELTGYYNPLNKDAAWYKKHWNSGVIENQLKDEVYLTPHAYRGYWRSPGANRAVHEALYFGRSTKGTKGLRTSHGIWRGPKWLDDEGKKKWLKDNRDKLPRPVTGVSNPSFGGHWNTVAGRWKAKDSAWSVTGNRAYSAPYKSWQTRQAEGDYTWLYGSGRLPWSGIRSNRQAIDIDFDWYNKAEPYQQAAKALNISSFTLPKHLLKAEQYMERLKENPQYKSPYQMQIQDLYDKLQNLKVDTSGKVQGLDTKISDITQNLVDNYATSDSVRNQLGGYLKTGDFNQSMQDNLKALGVTLEGGAIKNIGGLDINKVMSDIQTQGGDISSLTQDFAGLQGDLATVQQQGKDSLTALESQLKADYGTKLSDLESTFSGDIKDTRQALQADITGLTGVTGQLGKDLSGLEAGFTAQKAATADKFSDVQSQFRTDIGDLGKDFSDRLSSAKSQTAADILGVKSALSTGLAGQTASREQAISGLKEDWTGQLRAQEQGLSNEIAAAQDQLNQRLTKLSSTMNYKMLGDSAGGVRMRRSKAYKTGAATKGSGQLGRSMRISGLNI